MVVRNKRCIMIQCNACNLQIQVVDDLTCLLKLSFQVPKSPCGIFVVRQDGQGSQKYIQPRKVLCSMFAANPQPSVISLSSTSTTSPFIVVFPRLQT